MDLFGIKEHDQRHDEVERQLRRLIEQVAQLSIDLGVTRTELRRLALTVEGKVSEADVDPALIALDAGIKDARVKLAGPALAGAVPTRTAATQCHQSAAPLTMRPSLRVRIRWCMREISARS